MAHSTLSPVASESVATGTLMPLVSIKKHRKLAIKIFIAMLILAVPVAWFKGKPIYSATGVIYVAPRIANILQESKEQEISSYQQYQQFITQQASSVNRYDNMVTVLRRLGDKRFIWQDRAESERRAAERLQNELIAKPAKDTYLFTVTLESSKPQGLDEVVNEVINVYFEQARKEQMLYAAKERLEILYQQRDKFQQVIKEKKKRLLDIAKELSITTFVDNNSNPFDQLLSGSQLAYAAAQRERMAAEAELSVIENPKDPLSAQSLEAIVTDTVYKDEGLKSLRVDMYQQRSKLIEQIMGLDAKHPLYGQIKKQLDTIEGEVNEATAKTTAEVKHTLLEQRRAKVRLTREIEQGLLNKINEQKKNATWFSSNYNEALSLTQDIKHFYGQLELVSNRIGFLELESKAPGFIRIESLARPPEIPVRGGRKKTFLIIVVLGVILSISVPIGIDALDKHVKTTGQVEKILGYKPLAALLDPTQAGISLKTIADQQRRLALALERERLRSGRNSNIVLLTAVKHSSATTSLAMALAIDYGKIDVRAVVVEVNGIKPDKRYMNCKIPYSLLSMLLDESISVEQAVNPANGLYPDRIAVGLTPDELLFGYERLQKALERIASVYNVVILDAAPILFCADVEFFASISNVTLLLIAAQETTPGEIKRAVQLLERVDPDVVSFIVTGLQIFHGGGYYAKVFSQSSSPADTDSAKPS